MAEPRTRLDVSQQGSRRRDLLLLLAGFLLCFRFLRFLGHVALRDPTIGSMQVEYRRA
jgi:hypothetical protein